MKCVLMGLICLGVMGSVSAGTLRLKSGPIDTSAAAAKTRNATVLSSAVQQTTSDGKICQLVQFRQSPNEEDRTQIEAVGGEIVGYVPDHALLVFINSSDCDLLKTVSGVEWTGDCLADYKLSAELDWTQPELEVVISLFKPDFLEQIELWIEQKQGAIMDSGRGAARASIRAKLSVATVRALAERAEVEWIEAFVQPELFNNVAVEAPRMNVKTVWNTHGLTGKGQVVAVSDTGLDSGDRATIHPDFAGRVKFANSWVYGADDWSDYDGHGTHVCGSVLGSGAASSNLYRGVAYEAELVMMAQADTNGFFHVPTFSSLFDMAYTNGARIQSDSWGNPGTGQYTSSSQSLDDYVWAHDDMLLLFAAGNSGNDADGDGVVDLRAIASPASAKNCLAVGASESARSEGGLAARTFGTVWTSFYKNQPVSGDFISAPWDKINQGMAAFSSRGPCADGRIKPDVVAPGTDVISCRSQVDGAGIHWGVLNDDYCYSGGTSMATPLVAGMSALVRQYFVEQRGIESPSAALMKAAIINGAVSLYPGQYGTGEWQEIPNAEGNVVEGWGQVNAGNTLFPEGKQNVFWDRNRLRTGEAQVFDLNVAEPNGISVTLVWTDPPASLISSKQLVNDLDLMLISPAGVTNRPNGLFLGDHTNNVEQVDLMNCETGRWTLVVSGYEVPQGPQPYALFSSFSGDADNAFEVTSVWHEPETVVGAEEPIELFASLTTGSRDLAVATMVWREDGGDWRYEPMNLAGTNGENVIYSSQIDVRAVGSEVDYYAYAFSYDMELVTSSTNHFRVNSSVFYVALDGSQTWPYDTLENAYTNLHQALADARSGMEIRVADGVYEMQLEVLDEEILLTSLNGPGSTVLDVSARNEPALMINDGTVSGFTVQGGTSSLASVGGGVTMAGGVLSNCWIRGNASSENGGGVYLLDGQVTDCRIEDNACTNSGGGLLVVGGVLSNCWIRDNASSKNGGGVYLLGGRVTDCRIEDNACTNFGGGLLVHGGLLAHSVVAGNASGSDAGGIEVWNGATIRNCTIANNQAGRVGGGVDIGGEALIENCIVVSNRAEMGGDNWYEWNSMDMRYSCTFPLPSGVGNLALDPLFADVGDYHLQSSYGRSTTNGWVMDVQNSPCIDFGNPLSDASNESAGTRINMGAYGNTAEASRSGTNETRLIVLSTAGTTDPAAGLHIYSAGDSSTISLTDEPFTVGTTQYQFSAWTLDDGWSQTTSTAQSVTCSMTSNWIVSASHDVFYRVDLSAGANGSVSFSNGWVAAGSNLTVTAMPDLYYAFDGWSGSLTTSANPLEIELNAPLSLSAAFIAAYTSSGVPQWWLGRYGLTNDFEAASMADQDHDGLSARQEYIAGTKPTDVRSVLKLKLDLQPGTNTVSWDAQADRLYTIYYGSDLNAGLTNLLVSYYAIFPWSLVLPDSLNAEERSMFYRIEVEYDD